MLFFFVFVVVGCFDNESFELKVVVVVFVK